MLGGIGFVEYATRHLFFNPKVIASNQLEDYFRVNSLFFDPNIYGRFLVVVMLLVTAWLLWAREKREVIAGAVLLFVLWAALVVTFSQSSFASLLVGLAVLGALRWNARRALALSAAALVVGIAVIAFAPGAGEGRPRLVEVRAEVHQRALRPHLRRRGAVRATSRSSGRAPARSRASTGAPSKVSAERATSASHTIPITVAAEQGLLGLIAYLALLAAALRAPGRITRATRPSAPPCWRRSSRSSRTR